MLQLALMFLTAVLFHITEYRNFHKFLGILGQFFFLFLYLWKSNCVFIRDYLHLTEFILPLLFVSVLTVFRTW